MRSLQSRLSLGLFVSLILAFAIMWFLVSHASRYLAEGYIATRMEHDVESLLTAVQFNQEGNLSLDSRRINPIFNQPFSGHYYKVMSNTMQLRSRSLWDQDLQVRPLKSGQSQRLYLHGPQRQPLLLLVRSFTKSEHPVTIAVAEDLSALDAELAHLQRYFILAAILLLAVLIGVQGLILHAGLRPLEKTRRELQALAQGELSLLDTNVPGEISPLVMEINHLLDILDKRLSRSRNALGDLAHALKKPLTVLGQLAQQPAMANNRDLQQTLNAQLESMQAQLTRILRRARLAGEGPVGRQFLVEEEINALLASLRQMYHDKSLNFEQRIPAKLTLAVDREDMLELIGNLLDNACKWATNTVRISIARNPSGTLIMVEDDGPGIDKSKLDELPRRGLRLDESIQGHGLGLAIVQDIVDGLGAQLQLQQSPDLGGLLASVQLNI